MEKIKLEAQTYQELAKLLWLEARTTGNPDKGFCSKVKPFLKSEQDVIYIMLSDFMEDGLDYKGHFLIKVIGDTKKLFEQEEYTTTTRCRNELTYLLMQMANSAMETAVATGVKAKELYSTMPQLKKPYFAKVALNVLENTFTTHTAFENAVKEAIEKDFGIGKQKAAAIWEVVADESVNNRISVVHNAYMAARAVSKADSWCTFRDVWNDAFRQMFTPNADAAGEFVCAIDLLISQGSENIKEQFERIGWSEDMKGFLLRALKQYQHQVYSGNQMH